MASRQPRPKGETAARGRTTSRAAQKAANASVAAKPRIAVRKTYKLYIGGSTPSVLRARRSRAG